MDERSAIAIRRERCARAVARHHAQTDDLLVIVERPFEIAHEKPGRADVRFGWKTITWGGDPVLHRTVNLADAASSDLGWLECGALPRQWGLCHLFLRRCDRHLELRHRG